MSCGAWLRGAALLGSVMVGMPGALWARSADAPNGNGRDAFQQAVAQARDAVLPHVVSILVVREDFNQSEAALSLSGGSGTVIDARGHVLTNAHVTQNGRRFRVVLNDGREFPALRVGEDPISDLAVLAIQRPGDAPFNHARFAGDARLLPGETVLAMGAPWGMRDSVSAGVVNNPRRLMVSLFEDEADYEQSLGPEQATARYYAWIQHDAAINPGNSGGPLVDLQGRIVGVNTRGNLFGGDMAFAVPAAVAEQVALDLIAHGRVPRSDWGFSVRSVRGTGLAEGALVNTVDRGSAAEAAGLKAGDRIVAVDGEPVALREPEDVPGFRRALSERAAGSRAVLRVRRAAQTLDLTLTSVAQDERSLPQVEFPTLGLSGSSLTQRMARARHRDSTDGVLVGGVRPGGPATTAQPPLQEGDVLLAFDGVALKDVDSLRAQALEPGEGWRTVRLRRGGHDLLSLIRPAPKRVIPESLNELVKAWAGWEVQPITQPMASSLTLPGAGFRITRVYADGPAARAELRTGDVIYALADVPVRPSGIKETRALDLRVRNASTEEPLPVQYWREGQARTADVVLVEQPTTNEQAARIWNATLSITLRGLTLYDRAERQLAANLQGVVVERVENGGYGGLAHLKEGDLLVQIDGAGVQAPEDVDRLLEEARTRKVHKLGLLVMRGADTRLLFVDAPWLEQS